jgi:hypothetical protein
MLDFLFSHDGTKSLFIQNTKICFFLYGAHKWTRSYSAVRCKAVAVHSQRRTGHNFTACATPFGRHHASSCTVEHAESIILIATLVGVSERYCSLNQMNREPGGGDFISNACLITPENTPLRFQIGKGGIILLRGFCSEEWT